MSGYHVAARLPWSTKKRRHREAMVQLRAHGRGRWRWFTVLIRWPRETMNAGGRGRIGSVTLEAKTWLTDEGLRGNLRRKMFVTLNARAGFGGRPDVENGCPVLSGQGKRCTWERGHLPMIVEWPAQPQRPVNTLGHSWAVQKLKKGSRVVQEPRRPRGVL